jgi:DNA replication licensing factor MCM4
MQGGMGMIYFNLIVQIIYRNIPRDRREALKQSATDPSTGLIDVSILATGQSSETRRKRQLLATALKVTHPTPKEITS